MTALQALTPTEQDIVWAIGMGLTNKEIGQARGTSASTVGHQISSITAKIVGTGRLSGDPVRISILRTVGWLQVPGERSVEWRSAAALVAA